MNEVPFYSNTSDDTHCVQAAFRIMLKYFLPEREFSWVQLDKMTHKVPGKGTWWFPMAAELKKFGLNSKIIEYFDYQRYLEEENGYIFSIFSDEVAKYFLEESNLTDVKKLIPEFLEKSSPEVRPATIKDLDKLLAAGWLVMLDVNSRSLNNRTGYSGHVVLVYKKLNNFYMIHDPGLPPNRSQKVPKAMLLKAWQYTGKKNTALFAVRPKT